MALLLPETAQNWGDAAKEKISPNIVQGGISALKTSASKINLDEFLLLRVLWKGRKDASEFYNSGIIPRDCLNDAHAHLAKWQPWQNYRNLPMRQPLGASKDIGAFSLVHYYQQQVLRIPPDLDVASELPKVVWTPIAARTRFKTREIYAAEAGTPTARPKDNLNTFSAKIRKAVNERNASDVTSESHDAVDDLSAAFDDSLRLNEEPTGEDIFETPQSSTRYQNLSQPFESPASPMIRNSTTIFSDEQIVNMALVLFLNALTMFHPEVRADWTPHRRQFCLSQSMKARTDGFLRHWNGDTPLAILEVKASLRSAKEQKIRMQEGAQMAAWIADQPETGLIQGHGNDKRRR